MAISTGLLVWWAANHAIVGSSNVNNIAGNITSFVLCLNLLYRPLRIIADKFNVLQMGMIAGERVFKLINETDVTENNGTLNANNIAGAVTFNKVNFGYLPNTLVLNNISFSLPAGQTLAIVGSTGSGKTSIISLINRLYKINSGQILIDGQPIENYELTSLRTKIAVVLQDVFLFSGSIFDNVTLHNKSITLQQVQAAAQQLGIHNFIMQLPGNYNYNVMERGATLSLGQRQLISFLRAILYNPAILILDEASSSIDTESEQLIQNAISNMVKNRTSIVIAHRLSTIQKANAIMVLNKGTITEIGTHTQLLQSNGAYANLHNMQFKNTVAVH
jgi:ATP-binding cassette, subfamily B, multidrug efflux pump